MQKSIILINIWATTNIRRTVFLSSKFGICNSIYFNLLQFNSLENRIYLNPLSAKHQRRLGQHTHIYTQAHIHTSTHTHKHTYTQAHTHDDIVRRNARCLKLGDEEEHRGCGEWVTWRFPNLRLQNFWFRNLPFPKFQVKFQLPFSKFPVSKFSVFEISYVSIYSFSRFAFPNLPFPSLPFPNFHDS